MGIGKTLKRIAGDSGEFSKLSFIDEAYLVGRLNKEEWYKGKLALLNLKFETLEKMKGGLALLDDANTLDS